MRRNGVGGRTVIREAQKDQGASCMTGGTWCSPENHRPPRAKAGVTLELERARDPWL